nr:U3 small nucleolar RNA-associated protein 14 homolog A-like [Ipomoea batatas]
MADLKSRGKEGAKGDRGKRRKFSRGKGSNKDERGKRRHGPGLPNVLRKQIALQDASDSDAADSDVAVGDLYEYEQGFAEEESKKNKRYDPVENYLSELHELPEDFKDENVTSEDEDYEDDENNQDRDDFEEDADERHSRMLQEITGLPGDAFVGKKKRSDTIVSEAYPESEYNPSREILEGDGRISIQDLLDPLQGKSGYSKLRKNIQRMEQKSMSINAPLPRPDQERLERKAAYEQSKKDITKWEPLVKRNREASTIYFDEDIDLGFSTVGAIAAEFEPRTEFEKKIASLVGDSEIVDAHRKDGARLLELNELSIDDVKDRQNQLAKMRSLLFRHEMKAKRLKNIKSKTYHRLLKKDRLKATTFAETDPEAAKELAMKQEFKRAEERMTLKHKNKSKWAQRILKRGLDVQDEGTRAALAEQLNQHALLTRKMNSMKEGNSSDESSDEDDIDEISADSDGDVATKLLNKAKDKTLKVLEEDEELPTTGVLSLPFMARSLKKRKEEADEEAKVALQQYEVSLNELKDKNVAEAQEKNVLSGRRVFGASKKQVQQSSDKMKSDNYYGDSDSEGVDADEAKDEGFGKNRTSQVEVSFDPNVLREESEIDHYSIFKSFEDIAKDPGPKTTYEVAIMAPKEKKKKKMKHLSDNNEKRITESASVADSKGITQSTVHDSDAEEMDDASDSDSEGQMIDGMLSSGVKSSYELPSQEELIRRAFAGDDVEEVFEKEKLDILNEENPEPEKPALLPGWGQWTNIQKKKGPPSWMLEQHENARIKREEALKKRKDARLNHVIISEKWDRKAEKLHTKTLPYPYTSTEVFEHSIRMPIGPEFNPVTAIGALNRPEVVKKAGVIIKPIKFEDVNPHERGEEHKQGEQKRKRGKSGGGRASRKSAKTN